MNEAKNFCGFKVGISHNQLASSNTILRKKLTIYKVVMQRVIYLNRMFITVITTAIHWTLS
jgi:hypothetical protein